MCDIDSDFKSELLDAEKVEENAASGRAVIQMRVGANVKNDCNECRESQTPR